METESSLSRVGRGGSPIGAYKIEQALAHLQSVWSIFKSITNRPLKNITENFLKNKSKMKTAAAFVFLVCLSVVQGQARLSVKRCLCQGSGVNMVRLQRVEKVEVYPPGPSCENVEIIVTLKNSAGQKCLNPESSFAQNYIKRAIKKR
ncbi:hypothetical protein SRHO_G00262540 [Serrasalmus rhombeus]